MSRPPDTPSAAFQRLSPSVLEAIEAGASVADAACRAGCAERTVERWIKRGRDHKAGPYGSFATAVEQPRDSRRLDVAAAEPLDRAGLEAEVARAARAGSVPAMKLMWEIIQSRKATPADARQLLGLKAKP